MIPATVSKRRVLQASCLVALLLAFALAHLSCGGQAVQPPPPQTGSAAPPPPPPQDPNDLCNCTDTEPDSADYRHDAKHMDLPQVTPTDVTVSDIFHWDVPPQPGFFAARQGRETQLFHVTNAILQFAWLRTGDCDLHLEIADSMDHNAPRIIIETPHMDSFCSARRQLAQQLKAKGFILNSNSGELPNPVPADVVGLAFQDFDHPQRGSVHVATVWELHPATVTLK